MSASSISVALQKANAILQKKIDNALTTEVYDTVAIMENESIFGIVYSTKTSGRYRRRGQSGGLGDDNNVVIVGGAAKGGVLEVQNITKVNPFLNGYNASGGISKNPSGMFLAPIVERGIGYDYHSPGPRPFTKTVIEELLRTNAHVDALKDGLQRQGVNVE